MDSLGNTLRGRSFHAGSLLGRALNIKSCGAVKAVYSPTSLCDIVKTKSSAYPKGSSENETHWTQLQGPRSETKGIMFFYIIEEKVLVRWPRKREMLEEGLWARGRGGWRGGPAEGPEAGTPMEKWPLRSGVIGEADRFLEQRQLESREETFSRTRRRSTEHMIHLFWVLTS